MGIELQSLYKEEIFICEMMWGSVPLLFKSNNIRDYDVVF